MSRKMIVVPLAGVLVLGACALEPETSAEAPGAPASVARAGLAPITPTTLPGVHNVMLLSDGVYSGGLPEGNEGFDSLASLGVRTVVSVDAGRPDVAAAESRGMRYVHIPVEYAGISRAEQMNLARAIRDLPRPIYVHCHHGKHRGPTAALVGLELTGEITPAFAEAAMTNVGTSPNYPGLWACARDAEVVPPTELDAWRADLPAVAEVSDFVGAMAGLDRAFDWLGLVREAGWKAPADHPDLAPVSLAGQTADLLRVAGEHPEQVEDQAAFDAALRAAGEYASALERALDAGDAEAAERSWADLSASCKDCHKVYRNHH
ncbi:MAG: cytochrome c [Phycisphaerales bacterium]